MRRRNFIQGLAVGAGLAATVGFGKAATAKQVKLPMQKFRTSDLELVPHTERLLMQVEVVGRVITADPVHINLHPLRVIPWEELKKDDIFRLRDPETGVVAQADESGGFSRAMEDPKWDFYCAWGVQVEDVPWVNFGGLACIGHCTLKADAQVELARPVKA